MVLPPQLRSTAPAPNAMSGRTNAAKGPLRRIFQRYERRPSRGGEASRRDAATARSYGMDPSRERRPAGDGAVVGLTVALTLGIWIDRPWPGWWLAGIVAFGVRRGGWTRTRAVLLVATLMLFGSGLGALAWASSRPVERRHVEGTLTLLTDPATVGSGVKAIGRLG